MVTVMAVSKPTAGNHTHIILDSRKFGAKSLKHLENSDQVIGDIVAYCIQVQRADSSAATENIS